MSHSPRVFQVFLLTLTMMLSAACPVFSSATRRGLPSITDREKPALAIGEMHLAQAEPHSQENDGEQRIQLGDQGRVVTQIQLMLNQLDFYEGELTGFYNDATALAVQSFQQSQQLDATGQVDRETWATLRAVFEASAQPSAPTPSQSATESTELPEDVTASLESPVEVPDIDHEADVSANSIELPPQDSADPATAATPEPTIDTQPDATTEATDQRWQDTGYNLVMVLIVVAVGIGFYGLGRMSGRRSHLHFPQKSAKSRSAHASPLQTQPVSDDADKATAKPSTSHQSLTPDQSPTRSSERPEAVLTSNTSITVIADDAINPTTRLPKETLLHALIRDLQSADPATRRKAIWELGQRGNTDAIAPLVDLMVNVDSQQRSLILAAIAEIGIRTLQPLSRALITSLQDESTDVRKNAIRDLTRVYELMTQVSTILRHAADDDDDDVRETACWAMDQLNRMRVAPALEERGRSPH